VTALAELSEALGVRVTGVRRATVHIDGRWQQHPTPGGRRCPTHGSA
jgi:hypothetical protein